jgi:hypothetical protein
MLTVVIDVAGIFRMVEDDGRNRRISTGSSTSAAVPTFSFWHSSWLFSADWYRTYLKYIVLTISVIFSLVDYFEFLPRACVYF